MEDPSEELNGVGSDGDGRRVRVYNGRDDDTTRSHSLLWQKIG